MDQKTRADLAELLAPFRVDQPVTFLGRAAILYVIEVPSLGGPVEVHHIYEGAGKWVAEEVTEAGGRRVLRLAEWAEVLAWIEQSRGWR